MTDGEGARAAGSTAGTLVAKGGDAALPAAGAPTAGTGDQVNASGSGGSEYGGASRGGSAGAPTAGTGGQAAVSGAAGTAGAGGGSTCPAFICLTEEQCSGVGITNTSVPVSYDPKSQCFTRSATCYPVGFDPKCVPAKCWHDVELCP